MYGPRGIGPGIIDCLCRFPGLLVVVPLIIGVMLFIPSGDVPGDCLSEAAVSFVFDDGYQSTFDIAFPLMEEYNFVGSTFVITSRVGTPGYMGFEELWILSGYGWEIGSHSITHPYLNRITPEEMAKEVSASREILEEHGLRIESFASPFGEYNRDVIEKVMETYVAHRTSWPPDLNNIPLDSDGNRYLLSSVTVLADTSVDEVKQWILKAQEESKWLILLFHRIDETGDYSWPSENLEEVLRFTKEHGFTGVTILNED